MCAQPVNISRAMDKGAKRNAMNKSDVTTMILEQDCIGIPNSRNLEFSVLDCFVDCKMCH